MFEDIVIGVIAGVLANAVFHAILFYARKKGSLRVVSASAI
jgi:hypothetical protein